eukprot:CAMPEP_0181211716 /NCGR_PEP_ID=MMETSP1096-20121128/23950_1 /TAXON_ID=156174 ORGANISM="Chrysochromulina ericina, Strain CCMP281" /NCGR_SAMPLE_ID=MMETSP1096 /ASSEMBLY_ACC=CAM_ASM_000453 /LENGTH=135 /DNA_ID=CAMNT_0023303167 /DNA_START=188 /DNA_END=594 /DNA_ORIENTATION=+
MHDAQRICNILWSMLRVALELSEGQERNPYTSERRERIVSSKYIYSIIERIKPSHMYSVPHESIVLASPELPGGEIAIDQAHGLTFRRGAAGNWLSLAATSWCPQVDVIASAGVDCDLLAGHFRGCEDNVWQLGE